ncbi:MAG TPA: HDOD domain-containing protein [Solirubrobacteraceae bacterium]|nr:HDOD domain-containing protein [Solirubrobacteraceae bacterium]
MSLLKLIFGRRPAPPPPPPAPRGDSLALTGAGLSDADLSLPATVTVTFGDRAFTATAARRGIGFPAEFALSDIQELVAPEPVAPAPPPAAITPPPPPPPPPAAVTAAEPPVEVAAEEPPVEVVADEPPVEELPVEELPADEPPAEAPPVEFAADARDIAVVRRPITDGEGAVVGYELVAAGDGVRGTAGLLLDVFGDIGIERLAGRHPAWVRIAPEFLLEVGTPPVRPDRVVLQIPAQPVSDEMLTALRRLQFSGYRLALEGIEPRLLQVCGMVKLPLAAAGDHDLAAMRARSLELVATDVATPEDLARARNLGFTKFQGDFFAQPDLTRRRRVGTGGIASLSALAAVMAPDASFEELEAAISSDVGLSLKLLRYVNSAFFSLPRTVESVREALTLLGTATVRRWAIVVALAQAADAAPNMLIELALQRARMCEVLGGSRELDAHDGHFTVGLFSVADALLDLPMQEVLEELPFSDEIRAALVDRTGPKGELLRQVVAYERGEFPTDDGSLQGAYGDAIEWAGGAASAAA